MDYVMDQCQQIFGIKQTPATDYINGLYGGAQPEGSRIFFSDFSDDPWNQVLGRGLRVVELGGP
jgi:hypothetical protein